MPKHCDLSICINGEQTFFINQKIISTYSEKLKKMIKQEKRKKREIEINNFPGGSNGFELISRYCYNNGKIEITFSNICLLYCCSVFLEMKQNLLDQTESFLEGIFYWSWNEILQTLKSCAQDDSILSYSDSCGLLDRLICGLLAKIAQTPGSNLKNSGGFRIEMEDNRKTPVARGSPLDPSLARILGSSSSSSSSSPSPMRISSPKSSGGSRTEILRVVRHVADDTSSGINYSATAPRSSLTRIFGCSPSSSSSPRISDGSRMEFPRVLHVADDTSIIINYSKMGPGSLSGSPLAKVFGSYSSSSSSTSPTTAAIQFSSSSSPKQWWFDDLSSLPPAIIEKLIKNLGSYGEENTSIILTRFILHYLKQRTPNSVYTGLADTAIYGITLSGKSSFSCRGLLRILKMLSGFGLSKTCRMKLERLIGAKLDEATLDDLLISGQERGDMYDVKLVLRLVRIFVNDNYNDTDGELMMDSIERMKKVGGLIDKYLAEISPDHNLKMSKFVGVAQSLPDSARDSFDGVYKAIDMYLQSHPSLTMEERSKVCKCINYEKLSLEACKDLAKNPRIPPTVAIQALKSQSKSYEVVNGNFTEENEDMKINIQRMQRRVIELEKICKDMKGQMSLLVNHNHNQNNVIIPAFSPFPPRTLPRLC
ncbi:Phototropic-responsive NPH3 family protein [Euphorbia peplus]|nr:Phototropic-responsive NPH3 family protein [Euphorbia peplus]